VAPGGIDGGFLLVKLFGFLLPVNEESDPTIPVADAPGLPRPHFLIGGPDPLHESPAVPP
jgi:hypothetical protein